MNCMDTRCANLLNLLRHVVSGSQDAHIVLDITTVMQPSVPLQKCSLAPDEAKTTSTDHLLNLVQHDLKLLQPMLTFLPIILLPYSLKLTPPFLLVRFSV